MKPNFFLAKSLCILLILGSCGAASDTLAGQRRRSRAHSARTHSGANWYFAVSGDSRDCGDLVMPKIAWSLANNRSEPVQFYWHLGDYRAIYRPDCDIAKRQNPAYDCDNQPTTSTPDYVNMAWDDFIGKQMLPFGQTPVFLAVGNHELYGGLTRAKLQEKFERWYTTDPIESQRLADEARGIHNEKGNTYYHFIRSGVDFIVLDNADFAQFTDAQLDWLAKVLAADAANPSVKTIIAGMHAALPDSKSRNHAMDDRKQGQCSGGRAYELLYGAQKLQGPVSKRKRVYVFSSHSHRFLENIYDTPAHAGKVLPGWIVGTAGAEQYNTDVLKYGYLLVGVKSNGTIQTRYVEVKRGDLPANPEADQNGVADYCFQRNRRKPVYQPPPVFDCAAK